MAKENNILLQYGKNLTELNHIQVRQWWCAINSWGILHTKDITQSSIVDPWWGMNMVMAWVVIC